MSSNLHLKDREINLHKKQASKFYSFLSNTEQFHAHWIWTLISY